MRVRFVVVEGAAEARDHGAELVLDFSVQWADHEGERALATYRRYLAVLGEYEAERFVLPKDQVLVTGPTLGVVVRVEEQNAEE